MLALRLSLHLMVSFWGLFRVAPRKEGTSIDMAIARDIDRAIAIDVDIHIAIDIERGTRAQVKHIYIYIYIHAYLTWRNIVEAVLLEILNSTKPYLCLHSPTRRGP